MEPRTAARIFASLLIAALFAGCASGVVRREGVDATARLSLVSVVIPRNAEGTSEANARVLQAAVDHADAAVRSGLARVRQWKVLSASESKVGSAELSSFGSANLAELAALFHQPADQEQAKEAVNAALAAWRERFLGVKGLLVVPREALLPDEEPSQQDPAVRPLMLQQAGKLCKALEVDAVAFVQVRHAVTHPRENAFIVTDERTDGLLSVTVTLTVVDRQGTVIVDMGLRPLDERSRTRDLLPLYRGAGKDAVKPENVDLADPKKKVARAFAALIDEAAGDLMAELGAELAK